MITALYAGIPRAVRSTTPVRRLDASNYVPKSVCYFPVQSASSKNRCDVTRKYACSMSLCAAFQWHNFYGKNHKTCHVFTETLLRCCFSYTNKNTQINWVVRCVWKSKESKAKFNSEMGIHTRFHRPRLATTCDRSSQLYFICGISIIISFGWGKGTRKLLGALQNNTVLSLPDVKIWFHGFPTSSLVTVLTELPRLVKSNNT